MISRREFTKASLGVASVAALGGCGVWAESDSMLRKAIPSSGETLPIIGLGTNRFGVDSSEAARAPLRAALERFHHLGGTVIDTAPMYRTALPVAIYVRAGTSTSSPGFTSSARSAR